MDGLTIEQEQEYQRAKKVAEYLILNQTVVNSLTPLNAKQTTLNDQLTALGVAVVGKLVVTTGITTSKFNIRTDIADFYDGVCGLCKSFLLDQEKEGLAANFSITRPTFMNLPDGEVGPLVTRINKLITDYLLPDPLFGPFGITAITVLDGANLAAMFVAAIGTAPATAAGVSAAGLAVQAKLDQITVTIYSIALLVKSFRLTNTDFYNGFQAVNKIDDIGVHHTGIRGDVQAAAPVSGAVISCPALNKNARSNLLGEYDLIKIKAGLYEFTCTLPAPSSAILKKIIKIKSGKILEIDWAFS